MKIFPFPDREDSMEELKTDVLYTRIPLKDRENLCEMAWERGVHTARKIIEKYPGRRIDEIAGLEGVRVLVLPEEPVNGGLRTFGAYYPKSSQMVLYAGSIARWAKANTMSLAEAEDLVMAHEFFHFLECTRVGESSDLYRLPILKIGKLVLLRSGVRALSEISAHGFARTYYETQEFIDVTE